MTGCNHQGRRSISKRRTLRAEAIVHRMFLASIASMCYLSTCYAKENDVTIQCSIIIKADKYKDPLPFEMGAVYLYHFIGGDHAEERSVSSPVNERQTLSLKKDDTVYYLEGVTHSYGEKHTERIVIVRSTGQYFSRTVSEDDETHKLTATLGSGACVLLPDTKKM